jgi:hypothetical protein
VAFRRRQAWLAVLCLSLAIVGLLAVVVGALPGLVLLLVFGPIGLLCVLNARAGHRGGHSVRLVARDGATQLEFPSHRLGTALALVLPLVAVVSLSTLVASLLVYYWYGIQGSLAADTAAAFFAVVTGDGWPGGGRRAVRRHTGVGRLSGSAPRESSWPTRSRAGSCPGICIRC